MSWSSTYSHGFGTITLFLLGVKHEKAHTEVKVLINLTQNYGIQRVTKLQSCICNLPLSLMFDWCH